jgi:hypothetical protein
MRFKEAEKRSQERRLGRALAQLLSPDSGQVDEPVRPTFVPERCGKRAKREGDGVI